MNHLLGLLFLLVTVQSQQSLIGTWTTKSNTTITGPAFYDALTDGLIEPFHPGISYSFTAMGYYESAYYRAVSNPSNPACPSAILQWQHGTYSVLPNKSISMVPISVDGRQLLSAPCKAKTSLYTTFNQTELFKWFELLIDPYHKIPRLNLYRFDGAPVPPLYQVFTEPVMHPTTTLHPYARSTSEAGSRLLKRLVDSDDKGEEKNKKGWEVTKECVWAFGLGSILLGWILFSVTFDGISGKVKSGRIGRVKRGGSKRGGDGRQYQSHGRMKAGEREGGVE